MDLRIDRLTLDHVDAATRLSTSVGWNQTPADWRRLIDGFTGTCFGGWVDGRLVATSTLATYDGDVGWIGMVLVDEQHRTQGYGSAIFEAALDAGRTRDLATIGLDATDAGRRVYDTYGFSAIERIDRWRGLLPSTPAPDVTAFSTAAPIESFDEAHTGVNRTKLLDQLLAASDTVGLRHTSDGATDGYLIIRPGRTSPHVGPVLADSPEILSALLGTAGHRVEASVVMDVLRREWIADILHETGLERSRALHRMTHGGTTPALDGSGIVAATGFEWG